MESQQDHRKADEEKQAGLGDGTVFFCLFVCFYNFVPHKTILGGGGGHNSKTQGLSIYLAETIFFIWLPQSKCLRLHNGILKFVKINKYIVKYIVYLYNRPLKKL